MKATSERSKSYTDGKTCKTPLILAFSEEIDNIGMPAGTCGVKNLKAGDILGEGTVMALYDNDSSAITNMVLFDNRSIPELENYVLIDLKRGDLDTETGEYTDADGNVYAELNDAGMAVFDSDVLSYVTNETGLVNADIYIDGTKATTVYLPINDESTFMSIVNSNMFMLTGETDGLFGVAMYQGNELGVAAFTVEDGQPVLCTAEHSLKFVFTARDATWIEWKGGSDK